MDRIPSNLLQKNAIRALEVLKTAACPSPHENSTTLIKLEKILHLMALKLLRINLLSLLFTISAML